MLNITSIVTMVMYVATVIIFAVMAYSAGRKYEKQLQELKDAKRDKETLQRVHDADLGIGASDSQLRERLREYGER